MKWLPTVSCGLLLVTISEERAKAQSPHWNFDFDGRAYLQYMRSDTERGAQAFGVSNWFTLGLARAGAHHTLGLHFMGSLEHYTLGECGYPRLLTPGFQCFEHSLEDRQHTHPLFMALNAVYEQHIDDHTEVRVLAGLAGEPTFGPMPFFHRASADFDPITPLTNDQLNPSHTAYGLASTTFTFGRTTWEASVFNGGAHDDNPNDLDLGALHSYAVRASANFSASLQGQVSFASIQPSEGGHGGHGPAVRMRAWSASLQRSTGDAEKGSALAAGWSTHDVHGEYAHSGLLEAQVVRGRHILFGRAETVGRIEQEAVFTDLPDGSHVHEEVSHPYRVNEVALGYAIRLPDFLGAATALGARASLNPIPDYIRARYLADHAFGFAVFASLRPGGAGAHHAH